MAEKPDNIVLLGGGGHARVCCDVLRLTGRKIVAIVTSAVQCPVWLGAGCTHIKSDEAAISKLSPCSVVLVNAIGLQPVRGEPVRRRLFDFYQGHGFDFISLVHPSAVVSTDSKIMEGVQIMAGAVLQPGVQIGANTIINSKVSVDHDTTVGRHCHIAPGAVICGGVEIADECLVGAGATILPGVKLKKGSFVRAGQVVSK